MELDAGGTHSLYFIGPKHAGLEIEHLRMEITVITPQSPLGQNPSLHLQLPLTLHAAFFLVALATSAIFLVASKPPRALHCMPVNWKDVNSYNKC